MLYFSQIPHVLFRSPQFHIVLLVRYRSIQIQDNSCRKTVLEIFILLSAVTLSFVKRKRLVSPPAMRTSRFTELLDTFPQMTSPSSNVSLDDILAETACLSHRPSSLSDGDNNDYLRFLREPKPRRRLRKMTQSRTARTG